MTDTTKIKCPKCRVLIPQEDFNISTDIALCRRCSETYSFAKLLEDSETKNIDISIPPKGAWFRRTIRGFVVGATTRHVSAFFLVPFMIAWSGGSLGGIYGSQIASGKFNLVMSLFGLPFVAGTLIFGSIMLMTIMGKVEVVVERNEAYVFTGIGFLGWRRHFTWDKINKIKDVTEYSEGLPYKKIMLTTDTGKEIKFGNGVKKERIDYIRSVLRVMQNS
jgi:hypothetical protein